MGYRNQGGLIPLDKKASDQLSKEVYSAMFDENDNITDSAVRYASVNLYGVG
jgi:2-hydroxychromene-2-carboxylate isomerase